MEENRTEWVYESVEYSDGYHYTVFLPNDIGFGVPSEEVADRITKCVNSHDKLVEALNTAIRYKGGWREVMAMLQDYTSGKVEIVNMLAALDQMDRWSRQAKEAIKQAGSTP